VIQADKKDPFEEAVEIEVQASADDRDSPPAAAESSEHVPEQNGTDDALAAAEQDLARHRDAMLRMQAEMENLRKRLARDAEKSRKFALERIMKDLLQV